MKDGFKGVDTSGRPMFKWKVGQSLFMIFCDETTGKVEIAEWIVRTIRGGKVSAIWKFESTWGKRSKKNGDFGWLPNIPAWARETWRVDSEPNNLKTTKLSAIRKEMRSIDRRWFESDEAFEKAKKNLKSLETRNKTKKIKAS